MLLRDDQLLGMRVETDAGERIGTLIGFIVDAESGIVVQYRVRGRGLLAVFAPSSAELLIHHTQVIRIADRRVIVQSGSASSSERRKRTIPVVDRPQPVAQTVETMKE